MSGRINMASSSPTKRLKTIRRQPTYENKIGLIYQWVTAGAIAFKEYKKLLKEAHSYSGNEDPENIMG